MNKGFTLTKLLIVMLIIAILCAFAIPRFMAAEIDHDQLDQDLAEIAVDRFADAQLAHQRALGCFARVGTHIIESNATFWIGGLRVYNDTKHSITMEVVPDSSAFNITVKVNNSTYHRNSNGDWGWE